MYVSSSLSAPHAADNDDDALARRLELLKRGD